ncbi:MAG: hypothetical protein EOM22_16170, partial [Gammaproteobacteria bacterium]|nr:hypothetical protein [Gammaproteobacteria bacterium]
MSIKNLYQLDRPLLGDIATSVQALMRIASQSLGSDCILHAMLALQLLQREGIPARLSAGHAAWRIGTAPGAVVAHHAAADVIEDGGVVFHAWISLGDGEWIFDPTTYQLADKMAIIDAYDGLLTPIDVPDDWSGALLIPTADRATWADVRDARRTGVCCYDPVPSLAQVILAHPDSQTDRHTQQTLLAIYDSVRRRQPLR